MHWNFELMVLILGITDIKKNNPGSYITRISVSISHNSDKN